MIYRTTNVLKNIEYKNWIGSFYLFFFPFKLCNYQKLMVYIAVILLYIQESIHQFCIIGIQLSAPN